MIKEECYTCAFGDIVEYPLYRCRKPCEGIHGLTQAVKKGLFIYPMRFDPRFRKGNKSCCNYVCRFTNLP